ncbi:hypothetical protein FOWG_17410 [Fusarium oxysporum f. sp. lycopersici MN25]|nr:hypothetical protein FOWG_17410 [Fusarium oxysporum f. sp. lycopersici MN25]
MQRLSYEKGSEPFEAPEAAKVGRGSVGLQVRMWVRMR